MEKFKDYPADWAVTGYEGMQILAQGMAKAGSTDSDAVVKALEGLTYEGLKGKITFRKEDHQGNVPSFIGRTAKSDKYPFMILTDVQRIPAEKLWPSMEELNAARKGH